MGQQWFFYRTPEKLAAVNKQGEFNVHNIPGPLRYFLNVTPRRVIVWLCPLLAAAVPLALIRWRRAPRNRRSFWHWLLPTWRLAPTACLVALAGVPEEIIETALGGGHLPQTSYVDMAFSAPAEEFKEYCFALLVLLYFMSLFVRLRQARAAGDADPSAPPGADSPASGS